MVIHAQPAKLWRSLEPFPLLVWGAFPLLVWRAFPLLVWERNGGRRSVWLNGWREVILLEQKWKPLDGWVGASSLLFRSWGYMRVCLVHHLRSRVLFFLSIYLYSLREEPHWWSHPLGAIQVATEPPELLLRPHRPLPNPSLHVRAPQCRRHRLLHRCRKIRLCRTQDLADARLSRQWMLSTVTLESSPIAMCLSSSASPMPLRSSSALCCVRGPKARSSSRSPLSKATRSPRRATCPCICRSGESSVQSTSHQWHPLLFKWCSATPSPSHSWRRGISPRRSTPRTIPPARSGRAFSWRSFSVFSSICFCFALIYCALIGIWIAGEGCDEETGRASNLQRIEFLWFCSNF